MRRFLVLGLLAFPAPAVADELPPALFFSGCTSAIAGCVQGSLTPFYSTNFDAIFYTWTVTTTCELCDVNGIALRYLTAYDANGVEVYRYGAGNAGGGNYLNGEPATGVFQAFGPGADSPVVTFSTTPEPVTMLLAATGIAGIALARRRRRPEAGTLRS